MKTTKNIESIYALSPMQQGMLFHSLYAPESGVYVTQIILNLASKVDAAIMERAWQQVIDRHSIFRTFFVWENRQTPLQIVLKQVTLPWSNLDWRGKASTEQEQQLSELLQRQREQGFQLNQAPLINFTLIQLNDENHKLIWNQHHILMDGWSLPIIFKEFLNIYRAQLRDEPCNLPTPIRYQNYINWLDEQNKEEALEFWRETLQGFSAPTPLLVSPTHSNNQKKEASYSELELRLSAQVSRKLKNLAQENHITLSTIVQGVWGLLLSRYSGEKDVVFGVTVSGRTADLSGIENMVGLFINTLPLRLQIEPEKQLILWFKQINKSILEVQEHFYTPLFEIQTKSEVAGGQPLFESIVVFENYPIDDSLLSQENPIQLGKIESREQNNYPLTLIAIPGTELSVRISYKTEQFEQETIKRMLGHLETIFSSLVFETQQTVGEIPLISEAERHQLLVEWNDTEVDYPQDKCIHQLFEEQVKKSPNAIAVVFQEQELTYQELNNRANRLAHYLISLGVKPETLVGICVERSLEMIVGLLGILKAGGAYMPIDPSYPVERIAYMLEDSAVEILLTQERLLESLPVNTSKLVCLDKDWEQIKQYSDNNPVTSVSSDNLAYVIYTSGSTGKPKGVLILQKGVIRLVKQTNYINLTPEDRIAQVANFAFDAATFEIWGALLNGARLVLIAQDIILSPEQFAVHIYEQAISILHLTTALFNNISRFAPQAFSSLRCLMFGAEVASPDWVRKVLNQSAPNQLIHFYGPTEGTTFSSWYMVDNLPETAINLPIGRPISNTQIYILDYHLQPVPIGVTGELHIGGDGLARGYLNNPELTAEKFINNPFGDGRLYKTGDLGRYLPDGNIEYIGRIDNQVKIRGFRIELGEIEAVLNSRPQIQQAVVIAREDNPGEKRLVAYVVVKEETIDVNQLRTHIKEKLPDYMVPSAFVCLETFPLTPNGKIDRKALPAVDGEIFRIEKYIAPRTNIELILTIIWQEVLRKEEVSVYDNFFAIGGDSILSIQIVSRAQNQGIQITPKQIFQNPTITELAQVASTEVRRIKAQQGLVTGIAPLTPIQRWFFSQNYPEAHHFNQSVLLKIPSHLPNEIIEAAFKKILEHHDALRLTFTSQDSKYEQINNGLTNTIPFNLVDLSSTSTLKQRKVLETIAAEYQSSLNLKTGPIIQIVRLILGEDKDDRLLIIIHHLAIDGVSWRILLSDLETIYQQVIAQQPVKLSAKTTSFIDWAEKINNYAQTEKLKEELTYWLKQPWDKCQSLPRDFGSSDNAEDSIAIVSVKLSTEETSMLLGSASQAYNTQINDLLLSALGQVLADWTKTKNVLINLEGHGREELFDDVDLSRTVGWFTSLYPILLQLSSDQPEKIIKLTKEQLRAIPHRGIGYGILRYLCEDNKVQEQLEIIPKPEICFNYLGQFDQIQSEATIWDFAIESTGGNHSSKQIHNHLLDINAVIVQQELKFDWAYSRNIYNQATVENLAQNYLQAIRVILKHCQAEENFGYTPSDFPDARLNQSELDVLLKVLVNLNDKF